jgi:D-serine deaminase-like pyridoxal phosphate-dependent protein
MPPASLENLNTPCLVLDRGRLTKNLGRFAETVRARRVAFRPHMKTAKCIEIATLAVPNRSDPIAVSTLREAEYFHQHGYRDIFYAVGLGPGKFARVGRLVKAGANLLTSVDDLTTARSLARFAMDEKLSLRTLIEIDCGEHRGGRPPGDGDLVAIAQALGSCFAGLTTHAGHSYGARTAGELLVIARNETLAVQQAAERLAAAGLNCALVTVGSSPTAITGNPLPGITEMRAGVYMFGDLFQAGIGTCRVDDLALTVLTEVIGRPENRSTLLVDAGAFALSKDVATSALPPPQQAGFGLVCDIDGRLLPGAKIERVWQEQGMVVAPQPFSLENFPVGTRLRILPNHACPTAAAHSSYHVVNGQRTVLAEWPRINGW